MNRICGLGDTASVHHAWKIGNDQTRSARFDARCLAVALYSIAPFTTLHLSKRQQFISPPAPCLPQCGHATGLHEPALTPILALDNVCICSPVIHLPLTYSSYRHNIKHFRRSGSPGSFTGVAKCVDQMVVLIRKHGQDCACQGVSFITVAA